MAKERLRNKRGIKNEVLKMHTWGSRTPVYIILGHGSQRLHCARHHPELGNTVAWGAPCLHIYYG